MKSLEIRRFVGKRGIAINDSVIETVTQRLAEQGFERYLPHELLNDNLYFRKSVEPVLFRGSHQSWYTNNKRREFKAIPNNITVTIRLQEGYLDIDQSGNCPEIFDRQGYCANVTMYGGIAYKYSRNQKAKLFDVANRTEIYNSYEYDSDINILLDDIQNSIRITEKNVK